jgi:hypothetical protein
MRSICRSSLLLRVLASPPRVPVARVSAFATSSVAVGPVVSAAMEWQAADAKAVRDAVRDGDWRGAVQYLGKSGAPTDPKLFERMCFAAVRKGSLHDGLAFVHKLLARGGQPTPLCYQALVVAWSQRALEEASTAAPAPSAAAHDSVGHASELLAEMQVRHTLSVRSNF